MSQLSMQTENALTLFQRCLFGKADKDMTHFLTPSARVIQLKKGDTLFVEGEPGSWIGFVIEGIVRLYRTSPEGKETVVRFIQPHELFAEVLLTGQQTYPVSANALENSTVLQISSSGLREIILKEPDFALRFIGLLTAHLKYLVSLIENRSTQDVKLRLLNYITHLADSHKTNRIKLPVPKGELALLLGTTPESLSRTLKQLTDSGKLIAQGNYLVLPDHSQPHADHEHPEYPEYPTREKRAPCPPT
jgi:CRP/FNR family transcriptional regulator